MSSVNIVTLDFPGVWVCRYWYPNTKHNNREDVSEYRVRIDHKNNGYVIHSTDGISDNSQLEARFTIDGVLATGTFMKGNSPNGDWAGMTYKGVFQLLLNDEYSHMEGLWVAAGYDNGQPKVFTGRWEISQAESQS